VKTLAEGDETKKAATGKASDVGRHLAFAGLAVVWILKESSGNPIGPSLVTPLLLFVASLSLDLLQYVWCSFIWTIFYNYNFEKHGSDEAKVDIPGAINWVAYICFWLKILALMLGWGSLGDVVINKWQLFT
jgi:hypothetical protein